VNIIQHSVIIGSLLGDGHIPVLRSLNTHFEKKQTARHRVYLDWHFDALWPYSSRISPVTQWLNGKRYQQHVYRTHADALFTTLRRKWYPDGRKVLPTDLELDPLSLAIWYCDDGSNYQEKRQIRFAAQSFAPAERERLVAALKKMDLEAYSQTNGEIKLRTCSYLNMLALVSPYVRLWPCFKHKIDRSKYQPPSWIRLEDRERSEMYRRYKRGESQAQIAAAIGRPIGTVSSNLRRQMGAQAAPLNNTSGVKNVFWDSERQKWVAVRHVGNRRVRTRCISKNAAIQLLEP